MIQPFVDKLMANEQLLRASFAERAPESYLQIVQRVVGVLHDEKDKWDTPDPKRIHDIDDSTNEGKQVFVLGSGESEPLTYWVVCISYGTSEANDTLGRIVSEHHTKDSNGLFAGLTDEGVRQMWQLAVNIVQRMKLITGSDD